MTFRPIVITVSADPSLSPCRRGFERHGEPVSIGVACPRGAAKRAERWSLTDQRGRPAPVQTTTLDYWGDGSVRWLLAEFAADVPADAPSYYALAPGDPDADPCALAFEQAGDLLRVDTSAAVFDVPRSGAGFLSAVRVGDGSLLQSTAITAEDDRGGRFMFVSRRLAIERSGPLRLVVRLDGALVGPGRQAWLDAAVRLVFFAGLGAVAVDVEVTNSRGAQHPGGARNLDDPGSVLIRDLSIDIQTNALESADLWGSLDHSDHMEPAGARFAVYQDSSGGPHWRHVNHRHRESRVPFRFRGFRAVRSGRIIEGLRATPIASIGGGPSRVSVALPRFWQLFPKSIEAAAGRCRIGMFPRLSGNLHELQGGERSTLTFGICFGRHTVSAEPLAWLRAPAAVSADPLSYRQAGVWAPLAAGSRLSSAGHDALVNSAIAGPHTFEQRREDIDEYGWRNFGALVPDPAAVDCQSRTHSNNQDDTIAGFLTRFMQSGDQRWWWLAADLARHVADIGLYHTTHDRAAYDGGGPQCAGSPGRGPCSERTYTTGLMLHHFLTGCQRSRAAVVQLANWVIDVDDGRTPRLRGAGNSINALIDAHRLTGEPRYLEKADALIARFVHSDDDMAAFLQALGKYLEHRADRGLVDARFEYARTVLLNYATWMSAPERSDLDAQDIRRAAVVEFGAWHSRDEGVRACVPGRLNKRLVLAGAGLSAAALFVIVLLIT